MTQTIIFSKNRACQLDLLLRSLKRLGEMLDSTHVIYTATDDEYDRGYMQCRYQNPGVTWHREKNFREQTLNLIRTGGSHVMFLCDDDVCVRHLVSNNYIQAALTNPDVLCFSLRLGVNTTNCYPLRVEQYAPAWEEIRGVRYWNWYGASGDFGYPGSLDGHVFKRDTLRALLATQEFEGPNQLEDRLQNQCLNIHQEYPMMACYPASVITGVPVNIVNTTHGNRHGETHPKTTEELNDTYLKGKRLNLGEIRPKDVTGAHTELELVFA